MQIASAQLAHGHGPIYSKQNLSTSSYVLYMSLLVTPLASMPMDNIPLQDPLDTLTRSRYPPRACAITSSRPMDHLNNIITSQNPRQSRGPLGTRRSQERSREQLFLNPKGGHQEAGFGFTPMARSRKGRRTKRRRTRALRTLTWSCRRGPQAPASSSNECSRTGARWYVVLGVTQ